MLDQYTELCATTNAGSSCRRDGDIRLQPLTEFEPCRWSKLSLPELLQPAFTETNVQGGQSARAPHARSSSNVTSPRLMVPPVTSNEQSAILQAIHSQWTSSRVFPYSTPSLEVACIILKNIASNRTAHQRVLFELESFASYISMSWWFHPVMSGIFAGNWLEVAFVPLVFLRPSELCIASRLMDELEKLVEGSVAPLVVNEYRIIADGNHRLISAWIWNVLHGCRNVLWQPESDAFQSIIEETLDKLSAGPIVKHEVLRNLSILVNEHGDRLAAVRKSLEPRELIESLPAVFLPEYSCGAVYKDSYEKNAQVERIPPEFFEVMNLASNVVLPERSSYHFTDSSLLPWFKVS